ncbi:MAG TPA: hypothetical protein VN368_03255 [Candidatus Methylomirabilis sp.]|nr:hypothetical protein [Candidatus Methylomirabilis sp.]
MQIKSNSRIFMAGKTGIGKTTLVKKVLYPMYTRRVFWDSLKLTWTRSRPFFRRSTVLRYETINLRYF